MNILNKTLIASTLVASASVSAAPLYLDLAGVDLSNTLATSGSPIAPTLGALFVDADGDQQTQAFDAFVTDPNATNTSYYIDSNGIPGIQTGDTVYDEIQGINVLIAGFGDGAADKEGFGTLWSLDVDYYLKGDVFVLPDANPSAPVNYVGNFNEGWMNFDLTIYDGIGNVISTLDDVLEFEFDYATSSVPTDGKSQLGLNLKLVGAEAGLLFDTAGNDFADLMTQSEVFFAATTDLVNQSNDPNLDANPFVNDDGYTVYTRETQLGSIDIRSVPEPTSIALLALGLLGLSRLRRKA